MDNRRFSIRAEGVGAGARREPRDSADVVAVPFWDRAIELTRLNWEVIAYVAIMAVAILTRTLDLGSRAMHHDESIHAYFSNYFLKSSDYTSTPGFLGGYDPTYHGPFLYVATALSFYLFGTNEATARIMPAI